MINIVYAVAVKINTAKLITGSVKALESYKFKKKKKDSCYDSRLQGLDQITSCWKIFSKQYIIIGNNVPTFDKINFDKINMLLKVPFHNLAH